MMRRAAGHSAQARARPAVSIGSRARIRTRIRVGPPPLPDDRPSARHTGIDHTTRLTPRSVGCGPREATNTLYSRNEGPRQGGFNDDLGTPAAEDAGADHQQPTGVDRGRTGRGHRRGHGRRRHTPAPADRIGGPYAALLDASSDLGPARDSTVQVTVALHGDSRPERLLGWGRENGPTGALGPGDEWAFVEGPPPSPALLPSTFTTTAERTARCSTPRPNNRTCRPH